MYIFAILEAILRNYMCVLAIVPELANGHKVGLEKIK
jgi:hypothetical protein